MIDVILALIFFYIIGYIVHRIIGKDGNAFHLCFIGGAGSCLGAFLEFITNHYTTTFAGAITLCLVCSFMVEFAVRKVKRKLWIRKVHKLGWLTQEDIDGELHIVPDDLKGWDTIEFDDE